jgi:hypothetical protein
MFEQEFCKLISERLSNNSYTTERSITYTFFSLLVLKGFCNPHELLLEYPHPAHHGKEKVDTYIPSTNSRNGLIMECKYDRKNTSAFPRTMKAGKVFNDLYRLASFDIDINAMKWFVYITDDIMSKYFTNNNFNDFFNLNQNKEMIINDNYLKERPNTFTNNIDEYGINEFKVKSTLKEDLPLNHKMRIYEVINI